MELQKLFESVSARAQAAEQISADQAAAAEEISATMEEVSTVIESLRELARIL